MSTHAIVHLKLVCRGTPGTNSQCSTPPSPFFEHIWIWKHFLDLKSPNKPIFRKFQNIEVISEKINLSWDSSSSKPAWLILRPTVMSTQWWSAGVLYSNWKGSRIIEWLAMIVKLESDRCSVTRPSRHWGIGDCILFGAAVWNFAWNVRGCWGKWISLYLSLTSQ